MILWERATDTVRWVRQHNRLVNVVRFAPSGRLIAAAGADKVCRIWDVATGELRQVLSRHPDDVNALTWLDDDTIITVSQDGTGRFWEVGTGQLADPVLFHSDHCMSVDSSVKGVVATCGEDATIRIWDQAGKPFRTLQQAGHAEMCQWSPDGELLACGCDDGFVHVLRPNGQLATKIGPYQAAVKSVAWSARSDRIAVGAYDGTVRLWDVSSGTELSRWSGPRLWPRSLAWAPDGRTVLVGTFSTTPARFEVPDELDAATELAAGEATFGVNHVAASDGVLAAGCDDGQVHLWARGAEHQSTYPVGNGSLVNSVALSAGGDLVAYGNFAGEFGIFSTVTDVPVLVKGYRGHPINRVSFAPDARRVAVADYEGSLVLYEWTGNTFTEVTSYKEHAGAIKDVVWVGSDRLVTISTDRTARLITTAGETLQVFTGHGELINSGSVGRIGTQSVLATASRDRTIRLHDLDDGRLLTVLTGHDESVKAVAWSGDGEALLLTGSYDFTGRLWELDPRTWELTRVRVLEAHRNAISSVCWLDGLPVTAGWDARVITWHRDGRIAAERPAGRIPAMTK